MPRLFSADDGTTSSNTTSRNNSSAKNSAGDSSWWLPWKSESKPKSKSAKPSVITRMGRTTKNWWDNSLDFINPFNDAPKPKPQQGYVPQNNKKKTGGGFFGWLNPPEEKEIRSVNDFLALPMPE